MARISTWKMVSYIIKILILQTRNSLAEQKSVVEIWCVLEISRVKMDWPFSVGDSHLGTMIMKRKNSVRMMTMDWVMTI